VINVGNETLKHGYGVQNWPGGTKSFKGYFKGDSKERGILRSAQSEYKGYFVANLPNGFGILNEDGQEYVG